MRRKHQSPVLYCGNIQNQELVKGLFDKSGRKLYITQNVYPRLDELNVEPVRELIQLAFEEHITVAHGADAGFGRGTKGAHVATFLVKHRREMKS